MSDSPMSKTFEVTKGFFLGDAIKRINDAIQKEGQKMNNDDDVTKQATRRATEARDIIQANAPEEKLLQFFGFAHLPDHLRVASEPFGVLAAFICNTLPRNPERTVALRKLLEAKDAAVRAVIFK